MVIEHVDMLKSLARLSRTCQQCQRLAEPKMYRHHTLRSGYGGGLIRHSLDKRTARESHIHTLAYFMDDEYEQNFECLQALLERSTHLREFEFESPECSTNEFEEAEEWNDMTDHLFRPFQAAIVHQHPPKHPPMVLHGKPLQMLNKRKSLRS